MTTSQEKIVFIGAGNMAQSIVGGLIQQGTPKQHITLCSPTQEKLSATQSKFGVLATTDNTQGVQNADVIVLAVKPANIRYVCEEIQPHITADTLIISVAAGITCDTMLHALNDKQPIIRCMPNTPSLVMQGAAGLFANEHVTENQRQQAEKILNAVGISCWVDQESDIDAVTAVSGSGPAYYFLIMEAMIESAQSLGLDQDTATKLTLQTALGAANLAQQSDCSVKELRKRVTSPNGTTERAIQSFETSDLRNMFTKAMQQAKDRAQELAIEFSEK